MPAWRQSLRRSASAEGHKLSPITRTTPRTKGAKLSEHSNIYETACYHCTLRIEVHTYPGTPAKLKYRQGDRMLVGAELPGCSFVRKVARAERISTAADAYKQRQAMEEVTLQERLFSTSEEAPYGR